MRLTCTPRQKRFAFRYLLVTRSFSVRIGRSRVQTTRTVRSFPEHSRSSSPDTVSTTLKNQRSYKSLLSLDAALDGVVESDLGHGLVFHEHGRHARLPARTPLRTAPVRANAASHTPPKKTHRTRWVRSPLSRERANRHRALRRPRPGPRRTWRRRCRRAGPKPRPCRRSAPPAFAT